VAPFNAQQTPSFLAVAICSVLLASGTVTTFTRPQFLLHTADSTPPPAPNSSTSVSDRRGSLRETKIMNDAADYVVSMPGGPRLEVMGSGLVSNAVWEVGCRLNGGD